MVHQTTRNNSLDDKEQDLRIKSYYDDNIELKKKVWIKNNFMI
jgi:hypothetical protein